ncbi:MAG: IS1634 family transposase [candidate division Zixibacteria bacterium]|nr:IS1634 family transposase [candidate division Zixibacteria bacterium]
MKLALKHKKNLIVLKSTKDIELKQGRSVGAAWLVYQLAKRLGIEKALGKNKPGQLALWQVIARVINRGSRLSAVRLAESHELCDILNIRESFNEDDLYANLKWLTEQQSRIEKRLCRIRRKGLKPELFLYDVTSSYLEGSQHELGDWGYQRDGKKGKQQIVVGLLCDESGDPVSVELFQGNSSDLKTFSNQVKKAASVFNCQRVTFVGDRGMIKSKQIEELGASDFNYITAISKVQIETFLKSGVFQLDLFEEQICEVEHDKIRYVLRRNPQRAKEMTATRAAKEAKIENLMQDRNQYLADHKRAWVSTALRRIRTKIERLKMDKWLSVKASGRTLSLVKDEAKLVEISKLDGCYVIKSDLPKEIDKQILHDRYKDLAKVEHAFRICKTGLLELRPWYVWTKKSSRGHALIVMLSYLITRQLELAWKNIDLTVKEGLNRLSQICSMKMAIKGGKFCHQIPQPREDQNQLLESVEVRLPEVLPYLGIIVASRKKLKSKS